MSDQPAVSPSSELVLKAECSKCSGLRNCDVRGHHLQQGDDHDVFWHVDWHILQCRGCDYVFVRKSSGNSEDYDYTEDGYGDQDVIYHLTVSYFPALARRSRPEWMRENGIEAPDVDALDAVLVELYGALDADLPMLSAIGIRTAFDVASDLLRIPAHLPFTAKLDALVTEKHIGALDRERVAAIVDAGSASTHRGWSPSSEDLSTMMDILEHFIYEAFVSPSRRLKLDAKAEKMKAGVPPRKKKPPLHAIAAAADSTQT